MLSYPLHKHTQLITLPLTSIWLPHLHSCPLGSHPQYWNNTCKLIPWTNLNLQKLVLDITRTEVLYLQTVYTLRNSMSQNRTTGPHYRNTMRGPSQEWRYISYFVWQNKVSVRRSGCRHTSCSGKRHQDIQHPSRVILKFIDLSFICAKQKLSFEIIITIIRSAIDSFDLIISKLRCSSYTWKQLCHIYKLRNTLVTMHYM